MSSVDMYDYYINYITLRSDYNINYIYNTESTVPYHIDHALL